MSREDKVLLERQYGLSGIYVLNPYFGIEDGMIGVPNVRKKNENAAVLFGTDGKEENVAAAIRLIGLGNN
ncbi:MAG: hypothetical protein ACLTW9_12095 [Enterocloster sp.]